MNIVDCIVSIVVLAPLIYVAYWYYRQGNHSSGVADQTVRDLNEKSRLASKRGRQL